jgi:hypothetical protein
VAVAPLGVIGLALALLLTLGRWAGHSHAGGHRVPLPGGKTSRVGRASTRRSMGKVGRERALGIGKIAHSTAPHYASSIPRLTKCAGFDVCLRTKAQAVC